MAEEPLDEMGPIDYIVLEWPGQASRQGEAAPMILDLVDRGLIRVLDFAFMVKGEDGSMAALDAASLDASAASAISTAPRPGCSDQDDLEEAASALEPGTCAAVLVWENRWAAPVAVRCGAPAASSWPAAGIPVQAILASLEAIEASV